MAMSGGTGRCRNTTALPLKADLQAEMSASPPISFASPPGADVPGDAPVGPLVTQRRHSALLTNAVIDDATGEGGQDWRQGREPRPVCDFPTGGGCRAEKLVPENLGPD